MTFRAYVVLSKKSSIDNTAPKNNITFLLESIFMRHTKGRERILNRKKIEIDKIR